WIRHTCRDQMFDAPGYVVLHLAAPLVVARIQKMFAVADRAAEVWLQHPVAAVRQKLRDRIVAPRVAMPRTAVRDHHYRQFIWFDAFWKRKERRNLETIRRRVPDRPHFGKLLARKIFSDSVLDGERPCPSIKQISLARLSIARGRNEKQLLVPGS